MPMCWPGSLPGWGTNSVCIIVKYFTPIHKHMRKSREERRKHLRLGHPCIEIGGTSKQFRGLLAHFLRTTIPKTKTQRNWHLCHGCHNSKCSNPVHLYWGTCRDNRLDYLEAIGYVRKERNSSRAGSEEHRLRIRAGLKQYYSDPKILARQRRRMAYAQKFRKCFQRV